MVVRLAGQCANLIREVEVRKVMIFGEGVISWNIPQRVTQDNCILLHIQQIFSIRVSYAPKTMAVEADKRSRLSFTPPLLLALLKSFL